MRFLTWDWVARSDWKNKNKKNVICCVSQNSSKLLFSRLTTILTVAMVVQIRNNGGTGWSKITLHLLCCCAVLVFSSSFIYYQLLIWVFNPSPSRLFVMPDAVFGRNQVSSQRGAFPGGQLAVSYVASNVNWLLFFNKNGAVVQHRLG